MPLVELNPSAPIPLPELPSVLKFPQNALPMQLSDFVNDAADRISCPKDFLAVAAVVALSAVIGRKRMILGKRHDNWVVVPNLWGMIIGPPSAMKSPALAAALNPLDALEEDLASTYNQALREFELDCRLQKMQVTDQERAAKNALKQGGAEAARKLLQETQQVEIVAPTRPRLVVNDATVEKMQELLVSNQNGLLLIRDELSGLITKLDTEEFAEHRSFLLVAHNGRSRFVVDRIGRGTLILEAVCVSIVGGVQPARVSRLVDGAVNGRSDDGLLQRFQLSVWPDAQGKWKWKDRSPCAEARRKYEEVFQALHSLEHQDEALPMCDEAYERFKQWHISIRQEVDGGDLAPAIGAHLLKTPEAVLSLALIFQLCLDPLSQVVRGVAMDMALEWARYLRSHALRLYHSQSQPEVIAAKRLIKNREKLPQAFRARDIYRKHWEGLDRGGVAAAISLLIDFGHLYEVDELTGGRPSKVYQWAESTERGVSAGAKSD